MAKRSIGVTIGGVILGLQSVFFFLLTLFLATYHSHSEKTPRSLGVSGIYGMLFLLTATAAIGVVRLRPWARLLTLIMSGFGVFMSGIMVLSFLAFSHLRSGSQTAGGDVARTLTPAIVIGLLWMALSLWWCYVLNRRSVKQQFGQGTREGPASLRTGRPLSVAVIAILFMITPMALPQLWQLSASWSWILGVHVPRWLFCSVTVFLTAVSVCVGIGLWRLKPWARTAGIVYTVYEIISALLSSRTPFPTTARLPQSSSLNPERLKQMDAVVTQALIPIILTVIVIFLAIQLWVLMTRRESFHRSAEQV